MKVFQQRYFSVSALAVLILTTSLFAMWTSRPDVKVLLSGTVERDSQALQIEKAGLLNPGEVLHWTILSQNNGNAPAHQYKTIGQVPAGTAYVAGSAKAAGNVSILFSIDQGKTFASKPLVEQKQPDGSTRQVPAPTSLYTHIRYEWNEPLSEGKQVAASYKVRVQ